MNINEYLKEHAPNFAHLQFARAFNEVMLNLKEGIEAVYDTTELHPRSDLKMNEAALPQICRAVKENSWHRISCRLPAGHSGRHEGISKKIGLVLFYWPNTETATLTPAGDLKYV